MCGQLLIQSCLISSPSCSSPSLSFHTSALKRKALLPRSSCQDPAWLTHLLHLPPVLPLTPSHPPSFPDFHQGKICRASPLLFSFSSPCDSSARSLRFVSCPSDVPCPLQEQGLGLLGCSPFPSNPSHTKSPSPIHSPSL